MSCASLSNTSSSSEGAADPDIDKGPEQTRRTVLLGAMAATACLGCSDLSRAGEDPPGSDERPKKGDLLVFSEGEQEGKPITSADIPKGGPPVHAWPKDPVTSVVRSGSRLNEILIIRLDPAELDEQTGARAVDGILAYSAICSHAGCPVTAWVKSDAGDKEVFKCMCHNSEYDPRAGAQVVFGPAPRRLAALPIALAEGAISVAGSFVGKVGAVQPG
ncbi:Rieske 2Fe-2S domain-containing protein [Bradyrhizobium diazoefficiens]|jgi:rieske iron-sulfur protein|nr:Rieske 2Fe-2S domain-containing protein [Bradyrhizobium diazoefficiens]UCF51942.1 MAG: Rieske 2Fe-2S domain-containing protein [Bradyrhizobium sp.]MBR0967600.1 Rieske 2Fe-2S domain-containing protein [Bradyrhizobium diazoefficiens]MBR0980994.1 Rieske 2Fe-2S domain-containing protein [Bradyrhizobium diazoefficiens]MBR1010471.1 Rieske 2Fe-2S domain-containing protein [Bradyrhizobium diazoefficiens]MBR1017127.1 Rieske 2Fe-2S domain-containing protein [Bradyrhizobium diazoefficiens]